MLNRRRFLQVSATIAGGIAIQVTLGYAALPRSSARTAGGASIQNAYVRIEPDGGVLLIMSKVEMGQGTFTSLPMLVAEELEVDLNSVKVEHAPPAPDIYGVQGDQSTAALDLAATKSNWGSALPAGHGRGVAVQYPFGSYLAQVVEASVDPGNQVRVHKVVCAMDCGQMINPDTIRAQLEGGVMFGLSAALWFEIIIANGRVRQSNFHDYRALRLPEAPQVDVRLISSQESPAVSVRQGQPVPRLRSVMRFTQPPASVYARCP